MLRVARRNAGLERFDFPASPSLRRPSKPPPPSMRCAHEGEAGLRRTLASAFFVPGETYIQRGNQEAGLQRPR